LAISFIASPQPLSGREGLLNFLKLKFSPTGGDLEGATIKV